MTIQQWEEYRDNKSIELFGYPLSSFMDYGNYDQYEMKLTRYLHDLSCPEWKTVNIDNEIIYQISNTGKVKDEYGSNIKIYYNKSGYQTVWIRSKSNNQISHPKLVHRLVAEAFIPNPENKPEVDHYNNNKSINWYENLHWVTHQENIDHVINSGNQIVGVDHKNSKWTEDQIRRVCEMLENPDVIIRDIKKETGVSIKTINNIRFNKEWKHISKDYNIIVPKMNSGPRYSPLSLMIRDMIIEGKSNDEIIDELNMSELTSSVSRKSISDKIWYLRTKLL